MHRSLIRRTLLVAAVLMMGCGSSDEPQTAENLESVSSELTRCSATCANGSTVSCEGTRCSAVDGSHVVCDGAYKYCGTTPSCSGQLACSSVTGKPCTPNNSETSCCTSTGATVSCVCVNGRWGLCGA